jgi:hypothetical protein
MNAIVSLFLRVKHWQLFILSGIIFLAEVLVLKSHLPATGIPFLVRVAVTASGTMMLLAWIWSVGSFLNSIVQPSLRFNMPLFYFTLIVPVIYASLAPSLVLNVDMSLTFAKGALQALAVICVIYDVGLVADLLVRAETGKPASFTEVAGQFLLIWFFVLGVWSVQPRINRLYAERKKGFTPNEPLTHGATQFPG